MQIQGVTQMRATLEAVPAAMMVTDFNGQIHWVNSRLENLFGYSQSELRGQPVEILIPSRYRANHPQFRNHFTEQPTTRPMGANRDLYGLHKDGREIPVEIGLNPIDTEERRYILSSVVDISERQRHRQHLEEVNRRLSTALKERETLLQEVHHRVKNNLQLMSSLVNLQVRKLDSKEARDPLTDFQARLQSLALLHENLQSNHEGGQVPFRPYLRNLLSDIYVALGVRPGVQLEAGEIQECLLPLDRATPAGLIVNELITNAVKHAYPAGQNGHIWVEMHEREDRVRVAVRDQGIGLPPDFDLEQSTSLGLQVIQALTEQLHGTLSVSSKPHEETAFVLEFQKEVD